jgi:hypothetical protein
MCSIGLSPPAIEMNLLSCVWSSQMTILDSALPTMYAICSGNSVVYNGAGTPWAALMPCWQITQSRRFAPTIATQSSG